MRDKEGEIEMKNYVKPSVNVVELSVKESLSALPSGIQGKLGGVQYKAAAVVTMYNKLSASDLTKTE